MKEGLDILFALQEKDDRLKDIEGIIREIPQKIKNLEDERDAKSEIVEKAKKELLTNMQERKNLDKEIQLIKEKINKYKEQMKKVTTNKEFQGFISEIRFEESNILSHEEKIIEKMVENDGIMATVRMAENEFKKISDEYNIKIIELKEHLEYNRKKLSEEAENKKALRTQVSGDLLRVYDNLFAKKGGKVVSLVETEFCSACNIKIRPQLLSELVTSSDILICENCGRILFQKAIEETDE